MTSTEIASIILTAFAGGNYWGAAIGICIVLTSASAHLLAPLHPHVISGPARILLLACLAVAIAAIAAAIHPARALVVYDVFVTTISAAGIFSIAKSYLLPVLHQLEDELPQPLHAIVELLRRILFALDQRPND